MTVTFVYLTYLLNPFFVVLFNSNRKSPTNKELDHNAPNADPNVQEWIYIFGGEFIDFSSRLSVNDS